MPSVSASRSRRSRAPSPEPQPAGGGDLFAKVATGLLAYSINHYLSRQASSPTRSRSSLEHYASAPNRSPEDMPSKRSPSRGDQSRRAFGFASSDPRRDDPTHELISHLLRGAAALAAKHWMKRRKHSSSKRGGKAKAKGREPDNQNNNDNPARRTRPDRNAFPPPRLPRDDAPAAPYSRRRRRHPDHRHRPGSRYPCAARAPAGADAELVLALESLSAELGRAAGRIRQLAGATRPHRHWDGRCDVYEGLRECAGRLEGEVARVRAAGNNIRNLAEVLPAGNFGVVVPGENGEGAGGKRSERSSFVGTRAGPERRAGSYVRTREAPQKRESQGGGGKARVRREEDRGRKRTRSR